MQLAEDINFTTEKKELLSEKIHDEILELIIKNASEEEQVLNEKRLVELFGVSKAPVREALIKLCSEGVLRNVPRYGYVVVKMKEKDARDITKLRCILETEALKAGFDNIIQYHLPDIKAHIDRVWMTALMKSRMWEFTGRCRIKTWIRHWNCCGETFRPHWKIGCRADAYSRKERIL